MSDKLAGATIVKKENTNEAGAKLNSIKKQNSFDEFIETKRKVEQDNIKPLSSDLEIVTDVSQKDLMAYQGRFENGQEMPNGEKRLYAWDGKTRTAMLLKVAFLDKKKKKEK